MNRPISPIVINTVFVFVLAVTAATGQERSEDLYAAAAADRVRVFAKALERGDTAVLVHALDPHHLAMNAVLFPEFSFQNTRSLERAVLEWGLIPEAGAPFLTSIRQIERVSTYRLVTRRSPWRVYIDVVLTDGTTATYSLFMDPDTLYLSGASG